MLRLHSRMLSTVVFAMILTRYSRVIFLLSIITSLIPFSILAETQFDRKKFGFRFILWGFILILSRITISLVTLSLRNVSCFLDDIQTHITPLTIFFIEISGIIFLLPWIYVQVRIWIGGKYEVDSCYNTI
jgi:hypothetical protein